MAEWEEKLGSILNDPQAMEQIMSLARSLGGSGGESPPPAPSEAPPSPLSGLDPRLMEAGMRALSAWQDQDDRRAALLRALRPFVKPERYDKVDRAVQAAKLSRVIRTVLDGLKGGDDPV